MTQKIKQGRKKANVMCTLIDLEVSRKNDARKTKTKPLINPKATSVS